MHRLFINRYFTYHVVYRFQDGNGTVTITRNKKIKTAEDVRGIKEYVETQYDLKSVSIENWIRLNV